jgi:hypothetical protein
MALRPPGSPLANLARHSAGDQLPRSGTTTPLTPLRPEHRQPILLQPHIYQPINQAHSLPCHGQHGRGWRMENHDAASPNDHRGATGTYLVTTLVNEDELLTIASQTVLQK